MTRGTGGWASLWASLTAVGLAIAPAGAWAQTWSGGDAENDNWSDDDNWDTVAPDNDGTASLIFSEEGAGDSDIDDPWSILGMTFDADATAYDFTGGPLTLGTGGIDSSATDAIHAFNVDIELDGSQTWLGDFRLFNEVDTGSDGFTFTLDTTEDYHIIDFYEPISGDADWIKTGPGIVHFLASNTFTGDFELNEGELWLEAANALGSSELLTISGDSTIVPLGGPRTIGAVVSLEGDLTIGADAMETELTLERNASTLTFADDVNVVGGDRELTVENSLTTIAASATLDLDVNRLTLAVDEDSTARINGDVTGTGGLTKSGAGTLVLAGENDYTGDTILTAGTLGVGSNTALTADTALVVSGAGNLTADGGSRTVASDIQLDADLTVTGSQALRLDGTLAGGSNLIKAGSGTLTVANDGSHAGTSIEAGTLHLLEDATFDNAVTVDGGTFVLDGIVSDDVTVNEDGWLHGNGEVGANLLVNADGHVRPGSSIGTLTVGGDFTLAEDAEYVIEFSVADADNDRIEATGNAVLEADSQLTLSQLDTGFVPDGYTWDVLTAAAIDDQGTLIESDSLFLNYEGAVVASTYIITAERIAFADEAVGESNHVIAQALDSAVAAGPSQDLGALLNGLERLPDFAAYNAALPSIGPGAYNAVSQAAFQRNRSFNLNLSQQLALSRAGRTVDHVFAYAGPSPLAIASAQPFLWDDQYSDRLQDPDDAPRTAPRERDYEPVTRRSAGYTGEQRWNLFATGYGLFDNQDALDDRVGYQANTGGVLGGVEYILTETVTLGVTAGYSYTDLDFRHSRGDGEVHNLRVGPFATFADGPFFIDASVTYGYHDNDIDRRVLLGAYDETANGDYDAHDISAYAGTGYTITLADERTTLTPIAAVEYTHYRQDSIDESGGAGANLSIGSTNINSLRGTIGLQWAHAWITDGPRFYPNAWVGYTREFLTDENDFDFSIEGSDTFTLSGGKVDRNALRFGGGLSGLMNDNLSAYARYDGYIESNGDGHSVSAGLGFRF